VLSARDHCPRFVRHCLPRRHVGARRCKGLVNWLYEEFKAKGIEVLLVNFRESADLVKKTTQARGYTARRSLAATWQRI
jgi:hypothetical protein